MANERRVAVTCVVRALYRCMKKKHGTNAQVPCCYLFTFGTEEGLACISLIPKGSCLSVPIFTILTDLKRKLQPTSTSQTQLNFTLPKLLIGTRYQVAARNLQLRQQPPTTARSNS